MRLNDIQSLFENAISEISEVLNYPIAFYNFGINETLQNERRDLEHDKTFVIMLYSGMGTSENAGVLKLNWDLNFLILTEIVHESPESANNAFLKAEAIGLELIRFLQDAEKDPCNGLVFSPNAEFAPTEKPFFGNAFGQVLTLNIETYANA